MRDMNIGQSVSPVDDRIASFPVIESSVLDGARRIIEDGTSENTKHAYRTDMKYMMSWASVRGFPAIIPFSVEMVVTFIVDHVEGIPYEVDRDLVSSGVKRDFGTPAISTLKRRIASLSVAHNAAGGDNPCADPRVKDLISRARRAALKKGWSPQKKSALALDLLDRLLATCDGGSKHDVRDKALLLFAWSSGGRRRSETAAATIDRLELHGDEFVYRLGVTKTSQDEEAGYVPVAGRAAEAMHEWLDLLDRKTGPLFVGIFPNGEIQSTPIHPETVAVIVRRRARKAGITGAALKRFGGHSLRSGFMTEAGYQGLDIREAMDMSGHKTMQVAAGYYQAGHGLKNRAARLAG